jgi:para-nitrobenzyl esterase
MPRPRLARATALAAALALVCAVPPAAAHPRPGPPADPTAPVVRVEGGEVRGTVSADGRRFLGIPYAAAPTGALRFAPPRPAARWDGVRDATATPPSCAQSALATVEDCLVVNVHTPPGTGQPHYARRPLPVMVWFHGGAYTVGSAAGYDPTPLVTRGGVIVVGVNYRLGPLGFLTLPGQGPRGRDGVANAAVLDQQAALRWVRSNVAAFGGDPRNVTIFGESAGGHSVCMQLISPGARGLFRRAISQSGACTDGGLGPAPVAEAQANSLRYAATVGCTDPATALACLRAKPVAELLAAGGGLLALDWVPAVDGAVIPRPTREALASGRYNRVPMIVGSNRDEGRLFIQLQYHLGLQRPVTEEEYRAGVAGYAGDDVEAVLARYTPEAYGSRDLAMAAVLTDSTFSCPAVTTVRAASHPWRPPVFQYEFADPAPPVLFPDPFMPLGAYHASEIFSLFATLEGLRPYTPLTPAQQQLSDEMIGRWTAFARTGNPNVRGAQIWLPARGADPAVLSLLPGGASRLVRTVDDEHRCAFWESLRQSP